MKIRLNGRETDTDKTTVFGLRKEVSSDADIVIVNGFNIRSDREIKDGDDVVFIKKGVMPSAEILEIMMKARNTPCVNDALKNAVVGIAGLGGIGSHVAFALARLGVGKLVIADYDVVEPSNLNRQCYFVKDLGRKKTEATRENLLSVNPYIDIDVFDGYIDEKNVKEVFCNASVVVEAFDDPECKATLVNTLIGETDKTVVACSGMAGYGSGNEIATKRTLKRLYVVGDGISEAREGEGLMSPRVMITAGHQANEVLRSLMNIMEV